MAKSGHPGGPIGLFPPSCDPRYPRSKRYGSVSGWPLEVLWWRGRPPASAEAVQLDRDLWVRLQIAPEEAPQFRVAYDSVSESEGVSTGPRRGPS